MTKHKLPSPANTYNMSADVNHFIDFYKKYLKPDQIELLKLFSQNIYDFRLEKVDIFGPQHNPHVSGREALFIFNNEGVKGSITLSF